MARPGGGWKKGVLLYGVGFALLGFVVWRNWEPKGSNPGIKGLLQQTPDWPLFAALVALVGGYTLLQYTRWYVLVRALDLPFHLRDAARLGMVGTFYSTFLPGSVSGDLVKAYFIAKDRPGKRAAAVATVLADRLSGMFGLILYGAAVGGACWAAGNPYILASPFLQWAIGVFAGLVGLAGLGWVGVGLVPPHRADRFAGRLNRVPKAGHTLAELWYTARAYRRRPRALLLVVGLNAVIHTGMILAFYVAVRVFPNPDPATLAENFVIAPIGYIVQAGIPLPGGVGGAEAAFGVLYEALGRPDGTGVFGRFTLRVAEWAVGFVGYLVYLRTRAELPAVEAEAEQEGIGGHDDPTGEPAAATAP